MRLFSVQNDGQRNRFIQQRSRRPIGVQRRPMDQADRWPCVSQVDGAHATVAKGQAQANLIVLPARYADDFRRLCARNPVPCPLLGETKPGDPTIPCHLATDGDVTTDAPAYNVYRDGQLVGTRQDLKDVWQSDSVGFLIGCSFSFEAALVAAGLVPRHIEIDANVPMYKTSTRLSASGVFTGYMIVSMRPYKPEDVERVREITRAYGVTHGEPVDWGWDAVKRLGIKDLDKPEYGDAPQIRDGEGACPACLAFPTHAVPVFHGCGVTPQQAVRDSNIPGLVFGHAPGKMIALDITDDQIKALSA